MRIAFCIMLTEMMGALSRCALVRIQIRTSMDRPLEKLQIQLVLVPDSLLIDSTHHVDQYVSKLLAF